MEERVVLRNPGPSIAKLDLLGIGFVRTAVDEKGQALPELAADRWGRRAVPAQSHGPQGLRERRFRPRSTLQAGLGAPYRQNASSNSQPPSTKRPSEGWA